MSDAGYNLYAEAERLRYAARDPHVSLNQSLSDAIVLLTHAAEQLADVAEIERLRAENAVMREIVAALADAGHNVMQYSHRFGSPPYCSFPSCHYESRFEHSSECPVTKAQAFLTLYPG